MGPMLIVLIAVGIIALALVAVLIAVTVKLLKTKKRIASRKSHAADIEVSNGVRYTKETAVTDEEGMNVTHREGDIVLIRNVTYRVGHGCEIMPGAYTALSASGNEVRFKLRIGGIVRDYTHGDRLVLGGGEEITAVSSGVVLR